jgi:hypothetical protein
MGRLPQERPVFEVLKNKTIFRGDFRSILAMKGVFSARSERLKVANLTSWRLCEGVTGQLKRHNQENTCELSLIHKDNSSSPTSPDAKDSMIKTASVSSAANS